MIACLAPEIVIRSPITQRIKFVGIEQADDLLRRLFTIISDIRVDETIGEGEATQVLFWRGRIGRLFMEEANRIRLDDQGRIREMTIFLRPVPALLVLGAKLGASLAGRHHPLRGRLVGLLFGTISIVYRIAEPLVVLLVGAGVPLPPAERRPSAPPSDLARP